MRVAFLCASAQAGDAIGNQLAEKLAFFVERGADVRVFLDSDKRLHPSVRPHCQIMTSESARSPDEIAYPEAWKFLSTADLVIADYSQHYGLLELLPLLAGGRARLVLDYHGVTPAQLWTAHNREPLERGARQRGLVWCADAALVHSRFAADELLNPTGFPAERVYQIGYPVESTAADRPTATLRSELGLENAAILLFVGRLAPNKRLPVLVEAVAQLRGRVPRVHALVVGDSADVYESELYRCRARATELGVADRLHFLGHVDETRLRAAYSAADLFVMPSRHEGFCIPVLEAMAAGVPVVAARAGALPETVGDAGLPFEPDDAVDLARQVERVLGDGPRIARHSRPWRVAVVTCRYGDDFAGGAETSLRTIAQTLHRAGHQVEVYATTLRDLENTANRYSDGSTNLHGIPVHRFPTDPYNPDRRRAASQAIEQAGGLVAPDIEREFLTHSIRAHKLVAALREKIGQLDAVVAGPYLYGLTHDVATAFPEKTVLLPCFHDEPAARLTAFRQAYRNAGGMLYHSAEEQEHAEIELGLNHPGAVCSGTFLNTNELGDPQRGRELVGAGRRYLVYCGRYSAHKNVPLLLEMTRRYGGDRPGQFTFVFVGQGEVEVPKAEWARDLGFVAESIRRDIIAGADALVQLSRNESLSLVALEAWAHGVPLIADAGCAVLTAQLRRCGAGRVVGGYEAFAAALDDLWENAHRWSELGARGRAYVTREYGSEQAFTERLENALREQTEPLAERMRRRGHARAGRFGRAEWRSAFARLVEEWLHAPERPRRDEVRIQPRASGRRVRAGGEAVLLPVRIVNQGSHALVSDGPARVVLRCQVEDMDGRPVETKPLDTSLPGLLMPGRALNVATSVSVPAEAGKYLIRIRVVRPATSALPGCPQPVIPSEAVVPLEVEAGAQRGSGLDHLSDEVQSALVAAERLHRLPDDYSDVTQGWLASWKRQAKEKLLNNFKRAYVDVLSRQQTAFNRQLLTAVQELAEGFAALWEKVEHASRTEGHSRAENVGPPAVGITGGLTSSARQLPSALEEERIPS